MLKVNQQADDVPIALNPVWTTGAFKQRYQQIYQQLQQDHIKSLGLWLEDVSQFACVLLACLNAGVRVLLPPNLLAENRQWLKQNTEFFFTKADFPTYGVLQKTPIISPLFDKHCQTEIWLKTSGSSGKAKVICKTATQMWKEAETVAQVLPFSTHLPLYAIGSVSVQHLYGLTFRIFVALEMGWILGREQWQYPEYLIAESQTYPTIWISSPTVLSHFNFDNDTLCQAQVKGIISAGGVLPEPIGNAFRQQLHWCVVEVYGSTETGVIATRQEHSAWKALPHSTLGVNNEGALWVENPWINQREQTADVVNFSPQGFLLLGRIDRIVKLGDKRVSLEQMEQELLKHNWVADCYIGLHPQFQRPVAWLVLTESGKRHYYQDRKTVIAELKAFLSINQEKFALPRYWRFSDFLPRNSQSKINRVDFEHICDQSEHKT